MFALQFSLFNLTQFFAMTNFPCFKFIFSSFLIVSLISPFSLGYCCGNGKNSGFSGPPVVEQVAVDQVKVSWKDLVTHRECADSFVVK